MGLLKKLKRSEAKATVKDVAKTISLALELEKIGALKIHKDRCEASLYVEQWKGKDKNFIYNWCKNIYSAWCVMTSNVYNSNQVLHLTDLSLEGNKIGTFTVAKGLIQA